MLEDVMGGVCGIYCIMSLVYIVWWNVGRLYKAVKCRKVKKYCGQEACCYNICCKKYRETPTQEDIQLLQDLLAELKSSCNKV